MATKYLGLEVQVVVMRMTYKDLIERQMAVKEMNLNDWWQHFSLGAGTAVYLSEFI